MKKIWIGIGIVVVVVGADLGIDFIIKQASLPHIEALSNEEKTQTIEEQKYENYEKVSSLKKIEGISDTILVKFNGGLYGQSGKMIDYIGSPQIGTIDKLIPSEYVPNLDGETNTLEILGATVHLSAENEIVLGYQNEYRLFERIRGKNTGIGTFTQTYHVLNVAESNNENYIYLTLRKFQAEEVETVKVYRSIESNDIKKNKNYEFTFRYQIGTVEDNIKSIFEHSQLISVKETDKKGLEQRQDSIK